jgi:putative nucleotidyltransferase with HDIG domain
LSIVSNQTSLRKIYSEVKFETHVKPGFNVFVLQCGFQFGAISAMALRLAELIGGLSYALDLTEGQPKGHSIRCCWLGYQLGEAIGFNTAELSDLYYTLLLKDLGCSSNAARICELYLTDDRSFKQEFKHIDGSLPQALRFVLGHTGLNASLAERFRAIVNILKNGGEISRELIEARCHRGADIAALMRFSPRVCDGIRNLDEHWDGSGKPAQLAGRAIPLESQIALLAQVADVFYQLSGPAGALDEIAKRAGTWFSEDIVTVFRGVSASRDFWDTLADPHLQEKVQRLEPANEIRHVDDDYLDEIATAFAKVIDSKSPFTSGHSERVSVFSDLIAEQIGMQPDRRRRLRRAALLHDIGKLAISNSILDKQGKLTDEEYAIVKSHPAHGADILSSVSVFSELAQVAHNHHERLDGKGYPRGLSAPLLFVETRIVSVADVFDALTSERPYRAAMPVSQAFAIMDKEAELSFDSTYLTALKHALARAEQQAA